MQLDVPGGWETIRANVSKEARYVTIEGLQPAASYQFRVSAVNSVGEGEPSQPSNAVTLPQERNNSCLLQNRKKTVKLGH